MVKLVVVPELNKPLQGTGKRQYGHNGVPGKPLTQQILGNGGGIQGHVIRKYVTDQQLQRRKKASAVLATTTATLGLGALGAKGAAAGLRRAGRLVPAAKVEHGINNALVASAGLGGVGGYNYASIQRAEAKRQRAPIRKAYDSEGQRVRRLERGEKASAAVGNAGSAAAIGGLGGLYARDAAVKNWGGKILRHQGMKVSPEAMKEDFKGSPFRHTRATKARLKAFSVARKLPGAGSTKANATLVGLAGLGLAGSIGADRIKSYRQGRGAPNEPRYRPNR